jgi:endonuclease/exonuclease/phosphatase family metal-dependent hydrolase
MPTIPYLTLKAKDADSIRISERLLKLRTSLDASIPSRNINDSLLLATFNVREFDSEKYGERTDESIFYLAEIIQRFDLVAMQEVRRDLTGLRRLLDKLGAWWHYLVTDVTEGSKGNEERMAFLYDSRKVRFASLSGEVVIPDQGQNSPSEQLARTPFIVGFESGWYKFMLCTVHILYGEEKAVDPNRLKEIQMIANFLRKRVEDKYAWAENIILLGDFNIFDPDDVTMKAITNEGFRIPKNLQRLPSNVAQNKFYDQIAFLGTGFSSDIEAGRAGVFNFFKDVYLDEEEALYVPMMGPDYRTSSKGKKRNKQERKQYYSDWRTYQMSDHLPMWIELKIDLSGQYLEEVKSSVSAARKASRATRAPATGAARKSGR